jgi:hypothetical protein
MYLFHNTSLKALKSILSDKYIKSYSMLKKEGIKKIHGEGEGLYDENHFIYFSTIDKIFSRKINSRVILYFNSKLLYNRTFYVSTGHSHVPDELGEWEIYDESTNKKIKQYKRKYAKNYKYYNNVIKKLYKHSISVLKDANGFQVFQQIALKNKINLDELVAIEFQEKPSKSILKYIDKYYPNVIVKKDNIEYK